MTDPRISPSGDGAGRPYRLRLPGPTEVPARVLSAAAKPIVAHRGPRFLPVFERILERLKPVFGRGSRPFVFASTGIGGMESAVVNLVGPGDDVIVMTNGSWGGVFKRLCLGLGARVEEIQSKPGHALDLAALERKLAEKSYRAVFAVHSESSTGALADLAALGSLCARTEAVLAVDSVSGAGGVPIDQEACGVDVVVTASQKCLMTPPGLAMASVSDKAWAVIERDDRGPRGYFDYRKFRPMAEIGEPTYTAPVAMLHALDEALSMIQEEGLENVFARHARCSAALFAGAEALGFSRFPAATPTPTCAVLLTPEGIDALVFMKLMRERYNTEYAGTRYDDLKHRMVRIGTMGTIGPAEILTDLHLMARALADLGRPTDPAPALAAASAVLAA